MNTGVAPRHLRRLARGIGSVVSGVFLLIILASLRNWDAMPTPLVLFLVLSIAGVLVAWRWEALGGLVTIAAATGLGVFVYTHAGRNEFIAAAMYSGPFLLAGILFVVHSRIAKQR